jgi:iron complex transport system ATP-binding protein
LKLQVENVWFKYHTAPVLKDVSFDLAPAELVCLVGPNGSGKSTIIRCIDAILRPQRGRICIDDTDTSAMHRQELARRMGYVPQGAQQSFSTTVFDTVLMGRRPHASWRSSEKDTDKVIEVLQILGLDDLAMQDSNELSGGQQQRVMIARALAQEPDILLLDESTSALDICHQLEVMETLLALVRSNNIAAIMAMHDLNMASRYADRVLMLKEGRVYTEGPPVDIFTAENIAHVYGVDASVRIDDDGKPSIVPIRRIGNGSGEVEDLSEVATGKQL